MTSTTHHRGRGASAAGRTRRQPRRPVDVGYQAMAKRWDEVCSDPNLQDLPYKIETTASGTILMSPASNRHGALQVSIAIQLQRLLPSGKLITECSVATAKGVRVADVAWLSASFSRRHRDATPFPAAPEICVEVLSPTNSSEDIAAKVALYLERGAHEVWLCAGDGRMTFLDHQGALARSVLCPRFPTRIT